MSTLESWCQIILLFSHKYSCSVPVEEGRIGVRKQKCPNIHFRVSNIKKSFRLSKGIQCDLQLFSIAEKLTQFRQYKEWAYRLRLASVGQCDQLVYRMEYLILHILRKVGNIMDLLVVFSTAMAKL